MSFPQISVNPRVQAHYETCRRAGTSHNLAEMFALGSPPMSNTDREFLEGHCNGSQFDGSEEIADQYKREATAAGVSTTGKVYMSGLATYPGDPQAWVSGRGDVQRVCEERGFDCEGSVKVKGFKRDKAPKEVALAENIIDSEVDQIMAETPDAALVDREDLREQVKEKRTPYWAK